MPVENKGSIIIWWWANSFFDQFSNRVSLSFIKHPTKVVSCQLGLLKADKSFCCCYLSNYKRMIHSGVLSVPILKYFINNWPMDRVRGKVDSCHSQSCKLIKLNNYTIKNIEKAGEGESKKESESVRKILTASVWIGCKEKRRAAMKAVNWFTNKQQTLTITKKNMFKC